MSEHREHPTGRSAGSLRTRIAETARSAWQTHQRLLATNPAYAATLAAVVAAIATQGDPADLIAAVVTGALAVYSAARHHTPVH